MKKMSKRNQKILCAAALVLGLAIQLIAGGFNLYKINIGISALLLGVTSAIKALAGGRLIYLLVKTDDEIMREEKQKAIDVADERNVRLKEKSGNASFKVLFFVLCGYCLLVGLTSQGTVAVIGAAVMVLACPFLPAGFVRYYDKRI